MNWREPEEDGVRESRLLAQAGIVPAALAALRSGISRFGSARIPLADALVSVDLDLSNRPYLVYHVELVRDWVGQFDAALVEDFLYALSTNGGIDLHVNVSYGRSVHHTVEGIFKGLGRALDQATRIDPRITGPLSTKGSL